MACFGRRFLFEGLLAHYTNWQTFPIFYHIKINHYTNGLPYNRYIDLIIIQMACHTTEIYFVELPGMNCTIRVLSGGTILPKQLHRYFLRELYHRRRSMLNSWARIHKERTQFPMAGAQQNCLNL